MSKKSVTFSSDEMKKYLEDFDVLKNKYFYWLDNNRWTGIPERLKDKILRCWHKNSILDRYSVDDTIDTYLTLEKVYGKNYNDNTRVILPKLVTEKFLRDYVNIQSADKLFNPKYFGFEWGMHMEYKEKNKDYSYYRDHYVHQIRNMYEMLVLLDDFKFRDLCKSVYSQSSGIVGEYIWDSIDREILQLNKIDVEIFGKIYEVYHEYGGTFSLDEFQRDMYFHEIICSASILAALFHDIGYPVTYMSRVVDSLQDFIPIIRDFIDSRMNMTRIYAELEQSVLFQFASHEMIEKKLEDKDHGALSAVILLKYYYNKGFIRALSPVKNMVIELAAVMIFSHTLKYKIHGEKKWDVIQPIFYDNPLSYLFRLCDDIQEWNREYFEISYKHNYFICEKCHTMHYYDRNSKKYLCCCKGSEGLNLTSFEYRRLIQVNTSDKVQLEYDTENDPNKLFISIKYDLFKLLLMANYSSKFAKIRADEIRKIKKTLSNQRHFPRTFVDCIITANPIILKIKILERFIGIDFSYDLKLSQLNFNDTLDFLNDCDNKNNLKFLTHQIIDIIKEKCHWKDVGGVTQVTRQVMTDKINFYVCLLLIGKITNKYGKEIKIDNKTLDIDDLYSLVLNLATHPLFKRWDLRDSSLQYLCADYLWQCRNEQTFKQFCSKPDMKAYYDMYVQTEFISDEVVAYTNDSQYGDIVRKCSTSLLSNPIPIDFYSDLYMFHEFNEYMKEKEKEKG